MMETIGERIKLQRQSRGISGAEFARRCDISKSYLHALENGKHEISLAVAIRIADIMGLPLDVLASDDKIIVCSCGSKIRQPSEIEASMLAAMRFGTLAGALRVALKHFKDGE